MEGNKMNMKQAWNIVGGLSNTSKMPGWSYGLPALQTCPTARRIIKASIEQGTINNIICGSCYALQGAYQYSNGSVKATLRRLNTVIRAINDADFNELWISAMSFIIREKQIRAREKDCDYFRIHDSGDFFNEDYFSMWQEVARRVPSVKFWAPTREVKLWILANSDENHPTNLTVRLSSNKFDEFYPDTTIGATSGATRNGNVPDYVKMCPAPKQNGECGNCRNCWDSDGTIAYSAHGHKLSIAALEFKFTSKLSCVNA
jgi:hypothetical protein